MIEIEDSEVLTVRKAVAGPYYALTRRWATVERPFEYRVLNLDIGTQDGPYGTLEGALGALYGRTEPLGGGAALRVAL